MCIVKKIQKVSTINMESFGKVHHYFTTQNLLYRPKSQNDTPAGAKISWASQPNKICSTSEHPGRFKARSNTKGAW